jgi:hypothetical protein
MPPAIILFARAPEPGKVKTRLIPALGPDGAMELHVRLVADALDRLAAHGDLELHTDQPTAAWPSFTGPRRTQVPGSLGSKMFAALDGALRTRRNVLLAGSDAPRIPSGHLHHLLDSPADVALGPTEDGGFYAISCRRVHPLMFEGVHWSSGKELLETVRACQALGMSTEVGRLWFDIDHPKDLERARDLGIY